MNAALVASTLDSTAPDVRRGHKAEDAYRTISEVADELNVAQHVLRFWESKFKQIEPMKRAGGRRYYRREDVELLKRIHFLLYSQGYTIKGVQKLLLKDRALQQSVPSIPAKNGQAPVLEQTPVVPAPTSPALRAMVAGQGNGTIAVPQAFDAAPENLRTEDEDAVPDGQLSLFAASDRVMMADILRRLKQIQQNLTAAA